MRIIVTSGWGALQTLEKRHSLSIQSTKLFVMMDYELLKMNRLESRYKTFYKKWAETSIDLNNYKTLLQDFRDNFLATGLFSGDRELEQIYFRARADNVQDDTNPKEFTCPQPEITNQGRCNLKGYPVFYGSESPLVAVNETNILPGQKYYVSMWRSRENHPRYANFMFDENSTNKRIRDIYEHRKKLLLESRSINKLSNDESLWILNRITDLFLDESHSFSAAFAHDAIYDQGLDGIEYPDAKTKNCFNFALSPKFAEKLELVGVAYYHRESDSEFHGIKAGTPTNGKIVWRQYEPPHNWYEIADVKEREFSWSKNQSNL